MPPPVDAQAQRPEADAVYPVDVPFDQYQRYRIVAETAAALRHIVAGTTPLRVLDVGGSYQDDQGGARRPIRDFLPSDATVTVDLPLRPLAGYACASGDALPFQDGTFDLVACLDVLEHVAWHRRDALIDELKRTAARVIVVAAPFRSDLVEQAEQLLADFIARTWHEPQRQLEEHRANGLPDLEATAERARRHGWSVVIFPYGNLWRWLFMMLDKHAVGALPGGRPVHRTLDARFNQELFHREGVPPCYRQYLVATRPGAEAVLEFVRRRFTATAGFQPRAVRSAPEAALLFDLAHLHAANLELQVGGEPLRRDTHVQEIERHRVEMYRHLAAKDDYIAKLEGMLRKVERSPAHRVGQWVKRLLRPSGE